MTLPVKPAFRAGAAALLFGGLCASSLDAQGASALASRERAALDAFFAAEIARLRAPGLSVAIVRDGEVVYAEGFGFSRVADGTEAGPETIYRTASVAKALTATAVLQLASTGRMDLAEPVQRYCPAFPEKRWAVTVEHLLSHTSGVRHASDGEDAQTTFYSEVRDALGLFVGDSLLHEPGARVTYSTLGYMLLACAIEGATGRAYVEYLTEHVLAPAGMVATTRDTVSHEDRRRALGYRMTSGGLAPSDRVDTSFKLAGGGLSSTALDLARFAIAMEGGALLPPEWVARMWSAPTLPDGTVSPFGWGWQVATRDGEKLAVIAGQQDEVSSVLVVIPGRRAAIVLMSNLERSAPQFWALVPRIRELAGMGSQR